MGDERTGGAEGDDEQIKIDLDAVPEKQSVILPCLPPSPMAINSQPSGVLSSNPNNTVMLSPKLL